MMRFKVSGFCVFGVFARIVGITRDKAPFLLVEKNRRAFSAIWATDMDAIWLFSERLAIGPGGGGGGGGQKDCQS